ncbi:MAG TPA: bifunctional UDP-N-acetylmuramoyl-tripeptide:D-alanyl-D-alanine ligase/alanine racemase [Puia sp.]|jgi:alanine racemase|nr:bifunctional UDP-N-acetylmuramoyl-tripeptide:D-alanyl-D-alanine ligase/alanine racemase [Puia sp.]
MNYTIRHIAGIIAGELIAFHADDPIEHLLADSRRLIFPATSLFFSLRGPRRDGRAYLEELHRRGVRNFVVMDPVGGAVDAIAAKHLPGSNLIRVADTLAALQRLAAFHRAQFSIPVIAITGSNGKTIVKEWLNELLEPDYSIVRSPKSYNSQTGVPLSVWQLQPVHTLAIFEAGISRRQEMERLEAILKPTIGIFTNIGEAHSEGFSSLAEKAAEKLKLFDGAEVLICCGDQRETSEAIWKWKGERAGWDKNTPQVFSWGREKANDVWIREMETLAHATKVRVRYAGSGGELILPFTEHASVENAMHGVAVCLWLKLPLDKIAARVQQLAPIAMRLELKSGINHCSIINDSYSADLSSLSIALDFLSQQQQHEKRSVILSDILESGRPEAELYGEVGRALQLKNIDRLIGIGNRIGANAGAIGEWFTGEQVFLPSVAAFREEVHRLHFREETILLKGARVFEFEEIDRLLTEQIHQTVMEIDLEAMAGNLRAYRQLLQPATRVMAMVKAFAYGSGSFEIANLLQFHGVDYLGVAYADEAVALRKGGIRMPIMVMNTENAAFDSLVQYNLEPVIYSMPLLRSFEKWLKRQGIAAFPIHIELETGMNRLGFAAADWDELLRVLPAAPLKVQSVFSHFAASEEAQQDAFSKHQAAAYLEMAARLEKALGYTFIRHLSNSAAIARMPEWQLDMVRLGIGLYGIDSAGTGKLELQEVSTLKTTIAQIKRLHTGDTVGYNRRGVAGPGTVTATVRIGYADGYSRKLGNGVGKMWVKGRLAPTIGSISMDLTMIDITGIPDVREGDEVIVFGKQLSVSKLANWEQTIPYEVLTGVSQRVKRIYFE